MAPVRTVCVYCGSGFGRDPAFREAAEVLGTALARAGMAEARSRGAPHADFSF